MHIQLLNIPQLEGSCDGNYYAINRKSTFENASLKFDKMALAAKFDGCTQPNSDSSMFGPI